MTSCRTNIAIKQYTGIDAMKLFFAIMIVYMHCYCRDLGVMGAWVDNVVSSVGVPFFFITSGFFLERGLKNAESAKAYIRKYVKRVAYMYVAWAVITLPLFIWILNIAHPDYSLLYKIVYHVRTLFVSGALGIYWYVLSLIYVAPVFYLLHKKPRLTIPVYACAFICFIFGVYFLGGGFKEGSLIHFAVKSLFGSERNFLMVGFFYMSIGRIIYSKITLPHTNILYILLVIAMFLRTLECEYSSFSVLQAVIAFVTFLIALQVNERVSSSVGMTMRKLSTAIYLIHFPLILMFDFYLKKGTFLDMSVILVMAFIIYFTISHLPNKNIAKILFGN